MLARLREVVPLSDDDIARFNALRRRASIRTRACRCGCKLSEEEIARFAVNRWAFPGVDVVPYLTRSYPLGEEFAHVGRLCRPHRRERSGRGSTRANTPARRTSARPASSASTRTSCTASPATSRSKSMPTIAPMRVLEPRIAPKPGAEPVSHDRRASAGSRRSRVRRARRRRGRDRSAQRRSAGDGQRAELRSESVRQRHRERGLQRAAQRSGQAAAQSRAARRVYAGLDDEAVHGAGRTRARPAQARGHRAVGRRVPHSRASRAAIATTSAAATAASTWCRRSRSRSTRISIRSRYDMGIDRLSRVHEQARLRQADRHRSRRRKRRRAAVAGMEARALQPAVVSGRDGHRRHRPGLLGGDAAAARAGGVDHRRRRRAASAASVVRGAGRGIDAQARALPIRRRAKPNTSRTRPTGTRCRKA